MVDVNGGLCSYTGFYWDEIESVCWTAEQPKTVFVIFSVFLVLADAFFRAAISLIAEVPRTIGKN